MGSNPADTNDVAVSITDAAANTAAGSAQTFTVTVSSTGDSETVTMTLTETGNDTGIFNGTFEVGTATADATDDIKGLDGNVITVKYVKVVAGITQNFTAIVTVDAVAPVITGFSPAKGASQSATTAILTVTASDARSGFTVDSSATANINEAAVNATFKVDPAPVGGGYTGLSTVNATLDANGALSSSVSITLAANDAANTWQVDVKDKAGNIANIDVDLVAANTQDPTFFIDTTAPTIDSAKTGKGFDTATVLEIADKKAVEALFVEAAGLDATSVTTSDFLVDNVVPTSVIVPAARPSGVASGKWVVYLILSANLAADAKPVVKLVGAVNDRAGNGSPIGQVTASDGIKPTLTVTVTGDSVSGRAAAKTTVTARVVADEALAAAPTLTAQILELTNALVSEGGAAVAPNAPTATLVAANTWDYIIAKVNVGNADGLINIRATANDAAASPNTGIAGQGAGADADADGDSDVSIDLAKAVLAEFDSQFSKAVDPVITVNPATVAGKTDSTSPFIRIDFDSEAAEYNVSATTSFAAGVAAPNSSSSAIKTDAHEGVVLTAVTFGEDLMVAEDVLANAQRVDTNSFIVLASKLVVGKKYTIKVNGKDDLGNTRAAVFSYTFEVVAAKSFEITTVPGWNLISFPDAPASDSLDLVFADAAIKTVMTYDPAHILGPWLVAQRGADGKFSTSQLEKVDEKHAYWVESSNFAKITVTINRRSASADGGRLQPPQVNMAKGWNLVGVVDLDLHAIGTGADSGVYLGTVTWSFAYGYESTTGVWSRIKDVTSDNAGSAYATADATDELKIGSGYWVWTTADGVLVP